MKILMVHQMIETFKKRNLEYCVFTYLVNNNTKFNIDESELNFRLQ